MTEEAGTRLARGRARMGTGRGRSLSASAAAGVWRGRRLIRCHNITPTVWSHEGGGA